MEVNPLFLAQEMLDCQLLQLLLHNMVVQEEAQAEQLVAQAHHLQEVMEGDLMS
jgi:hypothetical protein